MNATQTKPAQTSTRQPCPVEPAALDLIWRHPDPGIWGTGEWEIYPGLGGVL
ncbi:hypothetical protein [Streptomyces rhizosphaericus]|uniref:hypothetical protein n=1 Tax=Streptomyces rhizosphaericus TaxID=114699 RepID=UPI00142D8F27|nr:hypothetical protein [Streptomyces rhizosphaericus]